MGKFKKNPQKQLESLASCVELVCPNLSTYYRLQAIEGRDDIQDVNSKHLGDSCPFCNRPFKPGSYRTRLIRKPKLTPKLSRLVNKYSDNPRKLGKFQRKLVEDYIEGKNKLLQKYNLIVKQFGSGFDTELLGVSSGSKLFAKDVTTCLTCKKKVKQRGQTRIERRKQKDKMISQKMVSIVKEEKPLTAEERKKEKKREKKKLLKRKRKAGLTGDDVNAGLTIPDVMLARGSTADCQSLKQEDAETTETDNKESTDKTSETETSETENLSKRDLSETSKTSIPENSTSKTAKAVKSKTSAIDLDKILAKKNEKGRGRVNSVISGSATTKRQGKKQLGQKLGLILKQEKKGPVQGTLSDFLSSL